MAKLHTPFCDRLGVRLPYAPNLEAQLWAIEDIRPAVFTFHLGDVPPERVRHLQSLGIKVGGSATSPKLGGSRRSAWTSSSRRAPKREGTAAATCATPTNP